MSIEPIADEQDAALIRTKLNALIALAESTAAAAAAVAAGLEAHESAPDAHPGYLTPAEASAAFDALGAAAAAIAAHLAAADPHPGYLTAAEGAAAFEPIGSADDAVGGHAAAANPHPQYLTAAEGAAAFDALGAAGAAASAATAAAIASIPANLPPMGMGTLVSSKNTRFYSLMSINGTGNTTGVANRSLAIPVYIGKTLTPGRLGMRCASFSANTNIRMAVYADADGQPGALLAESVSIPVTAAGANYEQALSGLTLSPGWYWLCLIMSTNSIVPLGVAIANTVDYLGRTSAGATIRALYRDFAFGPFPADESGQAYVESTTMLPPWIYLRTE